MDKKLEQLWQEHNNRLNGIIGRLTVPAMMKVHPLSTEGHQMLVEFSNWFDEEMEKITGDE